MCMESSNYTLIVAIIFVHQTVLLQRHREWMRNRKKLCAKPSHRFAKDNYHGEHKSIFRAGAHTSPYRIWSFNTKIVTNHFQQNAVIYLAARIKIMPGNDRIPTRLRVIT